MNRQSMLLNEMALYFNYVFRSKKFPDGMFNKTLLFTMQDGTQMVGWAASLYNCQ